MTTTLLLLFFALSLAVCGAVHDWRSLRIPNWINLGITGLFIVAVVLAPQDFSPLWVHLGAGALMLAITFTLFSLGQFGGGDAKLASALALWLGFKGLAPFVMFTGIVGGLLGLLGLYIKKKKPFVQPNSQAWVAQLQAGRNAIPYGIALAVGGVVAVFHTPPYAQKLHELLFLIH